MTRVVIAIFCSLSVCFGQNILNPYRFASAPATNLNSGLVAYWNLNESSTGSGAVTRVASVGFNLTDNGTTASAAGKISNGADFERSNSEFLSATDATAAVVDFSGNQDFTIAFWIKFESTAQDQNLIGKYAPTGNLRSWGVRYEFTVDRIRFFVSNNGTTTANATADTLGAPADATWYFVVAWHDATADTVNIQVNNGAVDSGAHSTGINNSSTSFRIGAWDSPETGFGDGVVDEAGIWNRVLNAAERTLLYNSNAGQTYPLP